MNHLLRILLGLLVLANYVSISREQLRTELVTKQGEMLRRIDAAKTQQELIELQASPLARRVHYLEVRYFGE